MSARAWLALACAAVLFYLFLWLVFLVGDALALTTRQFRAAECVVACGRNSSRAIRRRCLYDPQACGPACSTTTTTTTSPCSTTTTLPPCAG